VLLSLLIYGDATGVFSSRKIERATYDSVAFRFIAASSHPDHDTLAAFLDELAGLFVQVLDVAQEMKQLKLGTISLDGTKVHANASRHSTLSHGHIEKIEARQNKTGKKPGGTHRLCVAQANGRTRIRHHQIGAGISSIIITRTEQSER
jgi:hypothetical protein